MARSRSLLSRIDWILTGQDLLRQGGISAVKLAALTERLGVTTGSFYHHFSGFREFLDALADHYGSENAEAVSGLLSDVGDAAERLRLLRALAEDWNIGKLDLAMRVWATTDPRAAAAVARLDDRFIEALRASFSELGFSHEQARIRALTAFAAGVGKPLLFGHPSHPGDGVLALDVLIAGAPARDSVRDRGD
jgi:AcrR family transcriptional regulator